MSTVRPSLSVVIPTHERAVRLGNLLESLRAQALDRSSFEVVVVDDASRDGTATLLDEWQRRGELVVRVITLRPSRGPGVARNAGWRAARAPLVAFTDDDCEASPDWLERGLAACERQPGAIVQGRTDPLPRERHVRGPFVRTLEVHAAGPFYQTCNIFYPRWVLEDLGGFDEQYAGPVVEDTDLAWRAIEAGVSTGYADDALVYHAVEDLGPVGHLRLALRFSDGMQALRRHPGLREAVVERGVFWKRSHALFAQAALGIALARVGKPALLLACPYARQLIRRCATAGAGPRYAPYFVLYDTVEVIAAVRGGIRHGVAIV